MSNPTFTPETVRRDDEIEFTDPAVTYMAPGTAKVYEWRGDSLIVRWPVDIRGERGAVMPNLQAIDSNVIRSREITFTDAPRRWRIA